MKLLKLLLILPFIYLLACTSDPITIEIPGGPEIPIEDDTLMYNVIVEEDLCSSNIISFNTEVFPLIVSSCAYSGCHDAITKEDGIELTSYDKIMKEVNAGNANNSELYEVLIEDPNDDKFMPPLPAISLSQDQINLIKDWINQGANETTCKNECNSENTSFALDVEPIINNQCIGCHQPTNKLGSVDLVGYDQVRAFGLSGSILGSIKHKTGYTIMPETAYKMTDCQIATIENWLFEGAQNN